MLDSGIYCFENLENGKKYIGQAGDLYTRIGNHLRSLRKNEDSCTVLQKAWNKYGENNFKIYNLVRCILNDELLDKLEIFFIKFYHSHVSENGYNVSWGGDAPMRGLKFSEEHKRKIGLGNKNKGPKIGSHCSEETRNKIGAKNCKTYPGFVSPEGIEYTNIVNLSSFCRDNNLNRPHMVDVASGKRKHHKGWTRLEEQDNGK
jgi:group I intron endonuclease